MKEMFAMIQKSIPGDAKATKVTKCEQELTINKLNSFPGTKVDQMLPFPGMDSVRNEHKSAKKVRTDICERNKKRNRKTSTTRHIPAKQKRQCLNRTNYRCAYPNCNKPFAIIHHRERYAKSKSHESIIPLCKEHHEFAHNGVIENELTKNWKISDQPSRTIIDEKFLAGRLN